MPFQIIRNDITKVTADAIVNTANPKPVWGSGTDYAVYKAAGAEDLLAERKKIGPIEPGEAAATPAFRLPAKVIIHTVGPVWQGGTHGELETLASCYRNSLAIAKTLGCESIAFPLISTGVYGFPKDQALSVALHEIEAFLEENEMDVILVVFNKEAFDLSADLVEDVRQFIDDRYVKRRSREEYDWRPRSGSRGQSKSLSTLFRREKREDRPAPGKRKPRASMAEDFDMLAADLDASESMRESAIMFEASSMEDLPRIMDHIGESFQERLLRLIDERGLTDAEVYKKANLDRKLFSKIRCNPEYNPSKRTVVALAIALRLNLEETTDLLSRAGFALSPSSKFDLIVEYCIRKQIYNSFDINALLFEYDQPVLGC